MQHHLEVEGTHDLSNWEIVLNVRFQSIQSTFQGEDQRNIPHAQNMPHPRGKI